ncbi:MAG: hypothetical protein ACYTEQ_25260 [Planctomycetota bacterium]|jgi:hypothetical protein
MTTTPKPQQPHERFAQECDRVLRTLENLVDPPCDYYPAALEAVEFARSTRPTVLGMRNTAMSRRHVTKKMSAALQNIGRGARNWARDQQRYGGPDEAWESMYEYIHYK